MHWELYAQVHSWCRELDAKILGEPGKHWSYGLRSYLSAFLFFKAGFIFYTLK